ncbi:MAG: hypothetical protein VKI83_11265 [Synechococcaceae cyanobacterium]|nr:hypothetical protein [Synechococcaceae cyanobacterium]
MARSARLPSRHHRRLLLPLLGAGVLAGAAPAEAGLLRPVLMLIRPQLEMRLARVCVEAAAGDRPDLRRSLQEPCRKLAGPTSKCLIEETDASGRGLGVISELIGGRFGDDSEAVVKRCLARMFGLPADTLRDVPLRELGRRFGPMGRPPHGEADASSASLEREAQQGASGGRR